MPILRLDAAHRLATDTLVRCGTALIQAESVARALVGAEADGLKTHGLMRLLAYGEQVRAGKVVGDAVVTTARPKPGLLAIDAAHGFAYPALDTAIALLPEIAREQGSPPPPSAVRIIAGPRPAGGSLGRAGPRRHPVR